MQEKTEPLINQRLGVLVIIGESAKVGLRTFQSLEIDAIFHVDGLTIA